jgi:hypothetical protein
MLSPVFAATVGALLTWNYCSCSSCRLKKTAQYGPPIKETAAYLWLPV